MNVCLAHGGDLSEPSGGTDRVGAFVAGLVEHGHEVTVVAPAPAAEFDERFDGAVFVPVDVGTRGVVDQPVRAVRVARRARTVARERDARLQVEHSTLAGVASLVGCREYVLDMNDFAHRSPLYGDLPLGSLLQRGLRRIEGRGLRDAREVVVVSERMADLVAETWGVPPGRLTVIPNGYDPTTVAPYRDTGQVPGRVAFLGTLHRKVDADALRAVAERPAVSELVVVGDGERRRELEGLTSEVEALRVTGRLPDREAFPLVAGAQVLLNPQHASGLQAASSPVKLYYYAALGRAMVLSRGPELADWLGARDAARLVSPGDPAAFADAVAALLRSADERAELGANARDAVRAATWKRRAARLAELHERLRRDR